MDEPVFNCIIMLVGCQVATTLDRDVVFEKVKSCPGFDDYIEVPTIIQRGQDAAPETITARVHKGSIQAIV